MADLPTEPLIRLPALVLVLQDLDQMPARPDDYDPQWYPFTDEDRELVRTSGWDDDGSSH